MLQSFLSSVTVRLRGRLVPTHSYYYREGGKRPSPCAADSHYEIEGDKMAVRLGLTSCAEYASHEWLIDYRCLVMSILLVQLSAASTGGGE
jgi:hypothetical protein